MFNRYFLVLLLLVVLPSCREHKHLSKDFYSTSLFREVQLASVFPDSKTFVDCIPKRPLAEILEDYQVKKTSTDFDLKQFVLQNFELPERPNSTFATDTARSMEEHLTRLWPVLTRNPDEYDPASSLIPLTYPYIVPGGRFSEIYYWDSYFTMLGLKAQGRFEMIQNMVKNFAHLIDTIGFIPNGNRTYYLSRSQPPFFALMLNELEEYDTAAVLHYLPALQKEYSFWMHGSDQLQKPGDAEEHVVMLGGNFIVNRYFDKKEEPRPEAYKEDYRLAEQSETKNVLYRNLRSAAESGWDFSSRWFDAGEGLETIHTTDLIPVDLNCLLYHVENTIARGLQMKGNMTEAERFHDKAKQRANAIMTYCWDASSGFFYDYNYKKGEQSTVKTLAGTFPLFFKIVTPETAQHVADLVKRDFLKPGGLVTTLTVTGEQWDAPNGWAPLQWVVYKGLMNYQVNDLAAEIKKRWLRQNRRVYKATGRMMEKYNVMDTTLQAGGGEYPNQDGFGWTNGVGLAFVKE